jgi:hypothetical protein
MVSYPAPKTTPHAQHNDTLNTLFWNYHRCQHRSFHRSACSSPSRLPDSPGSLDPPPARLRPHRPIRPAALTCCPTGPGHLRSARHRTGPSLTAARPPRAASVPQSIATASPPHTGCPDVADYLATTKVFFYLNLSECG